MNPLRDTTAGILGILVGSGLSWLKDFISEKFKQKLKPLPFRLQVGDEAWHMGSASIVTIVGIFPRSIRPVKIRLPGGDTQFCRYDDISPLETSEGQP